MDDELLGGRPDPEGAEPGRRNRWSGLAGLFVVALIASLLPHASNPVGADDEAPPPSAGVVFTELPEGFIPFHLAEDGTVGGELIGLPTTVRNPAVWTPDGMDVFPADNVSLLSRFDGTDGFVGRSTSTDPTYWGPSGPIELTKPTNPDGNDYSARANWFGPDGSIYGTTGWRAREDRATGVRWASPGAAPELISRLSTLMWVMPDGRLFGVLDTEGSAVAAFDDGSRIDVASGMPRNFFPVAASPAGHLLGSAVGGPVVWYDGGTRTLPGYTSLVAVNSTGHVLARNSLGHFVLRDESGREQRIIDLIPPDTGITTVSAVYDLNDECQITGRGQRSVFGIPQLVGFRLNVPNCLPNLTVEITEAPGSQESVRVDTGFEIEAEISNKGDLPVTALALSGPTGVIGSPGMEVVDGPRWQTEENVAPTSLQPGASVRVRYTVASERVGIRSVGVEATGIYAQDPVVASRSRSVQIVPPVDIRVESAQTAETGPNEVFKVQVTVTNEWDQPLDRVQAVDVEIKGAGAFSRAGPFREDGSFVPFDRVPVPAGESFVWVYELSMADPFFPAEVEVQVNARDPETGSIFFLTGSSASPDPLQVELEASAPDGTEFEVTVTVRNEGNQPLDDVGFLDGGLAYNPELYEPDQRGDVEIVRGPTPELPSSLGPGEEATTTYVLSAEDEGSVLLVARVKGTPPTDTIQRAQDSLEVRIAPCERNYEAILDCVAEIFGDLIAVVNLEAIAGARRFENELAGQFPEGVSVPLAPNQRSIANYLPTVSETGSSLLPTVFEDSYEVARRGIPVYFESLGTSTWQAATGGVQALYGLGNLYVQNFVWVTPEVRNDNARRVLEFAVEEGGWQAEGIAEYVDVLKTAALGEPEDFDAAIERLVEIRRQNDEIAGQLILAAEGKVDAALDSFANWRQLASTDRVEASVQLLDGVGTVTGTTIGVAIEYFLGVRAARALSGSGLSKGATLVDDAADLTRAVEPPPKTKRPTNDTDAAGTRSGDGPSSPRSMDRKPRIEDLPPGEIAANALAELLNGHPVEVQQEFDRIIAELESELNVQIGIQARSAETEGIQKVLSGDALAKEQWNKAKSVNFVDTAFLGAPPSLTGNAAFYPPRPDWAKINAIPEGDPLRGLVEARIETQRQMWQKWSGETLDRNGNVVSTQSEPTAMRREYNQMLTDEGFDFRNEIRSRTLARELDGSPVRDPAGNLVYDVDEVVVQQRQVRLEMQEVDVGGGRTAFVPRDRATGLPFGADVDIFAVLDVSVDPPRGFTGSKRSEIEIRLQQKLRASKIPFGEHGWTHSGFDLTDELSSVRVQELYRVRSPAEAAAAVAKYPELFGLPADASPADIRRMQQKVGAGEYVITYTRNRRSIGFGSLPNLRFR